MWSLGYGLANSHRLFKFTMANIVNVSITGVDEHGSGQSICHAR